MEAQKRRVGTISGIEVLVWGAGTLSIRESDEPEREVRLEMRDIRPLVALLRVSELHGEMFDLELEDRAYERQKGPENGSHSRQDNDG